MWGEGKRKKRGDQNLPTHVWIGSESILHQRMQRGADLFTRCLRHLDIFQNLFLATQKGMKWFYINKGLFIGRKNFLSENWQFCLIEKHNFEYVVMLLKFGTFWKFFDFVPYGRKSQILKIWVKKIISRINYTMSMGVSKIYRIGS